MELTAFEIDEALRARACAVDDALDGSRAGAGVYWIHIESIGIGELEAWLAGLGLSDFVMTRMLRIGSSIGDSTSIDALQAFIVITAVPVTPLVLATLWTAPRLAWKEWQRSEAGEKGQ